MKKKTDNYKDFQSSVGLQYPDKTFADCVKALGISQKEIMNAVGHTNPTTCIKWMTGSDIYLRSLLEVCNQTGIDLLSLVQYYGHRFKSNIEDLYRLELTGTTIADVLRERGIDSSSATKLMDEELRASTNQRLIEQAEIHAQSRKKTDDTELTMSSIIDRIIDMQSKAHEHELTSLERQRIESREIIDSQREYFVTQMENQRKEMQAEMERQVKERQQHIDRLLNENTQLRSQLNANTGYSESRKYPLVSDNSKPTVSR